MQIGSILKNIREGKNLSIRNLAAKTNLSPAFISNIEKDINSPTINSLNKICHALDIHIVDLFLYNDLNNKNIIKYNERVVLFESEKSKIKYEILTSPDKKFQCLSITMGSGCDLGYESIAYQSDEIGIIFAGKMEVLLDNKDRFLLEKGDTIYIKANQKYKYCNPGTEECISIWFFQGNINTIKQSKVSIHDK